MNVAILWERLRGRYQTSLSQIFFKRPFVMRNTAPLISFTFDDFPRSAFLTGGAILEDHEVRGTYFASLGLTRKQTPVGEIFAPEDLKELLAQGHELGCHSYDHLHPWKTRARVFEESIIRNKNRLTELLPGADFKTFAYPLLYPRPRTKRRVATHFICCRAGGQKINAGLVDLNLLNAYFLERGGEDPGPVRDLIDLNQRARGWLIFATHDICSTPSPYGCTPGFLEKIVRYSVDSGAKILPVAQACLVLQAESPLV